MQQIVIATTGQIKRALHRLISSTAHEFSVYQALRDFHKDLENDLQRPDLNHEEDSTHADNLFH